MKKIFAVLLCALVGMTAAVGVVACKKNEDPDTAVLTVYAPDGAPALALAGLLHGGVTSASEQPSPKYTFKTSVVQAAAIKDQIGYADENKNADFCILPVNLAAAALGTGERYKLLGTVTNGNMYFLSTSEEPVSSPSDLVGKKVGVVQLNNVPGLTLRSVLKKAGADVQIIDLNADKAADKVNLVAFADASTVGPAGGCDCYLCPEPAVTAKTKSGAMHIVGDLQEMYGGGYPQAVAVAKVSVLSNYPEAVQTFLNALEGSASYLASADPADVLSDLEGCYNGFTPSFSAANLTAQSIANCSVRFTAAKDCKEKVNTFLSELIAVNPSFTSTVSDAFFYQGN